MGTNLNLSSALNVIYNRERMAPKIKAARGGLAEAASLRADGAIDGCEVADATQQHAKRGSLWLVTTGASEAPG